MNLSSLFRTSQCAPPTRKEIGNAAELQALKYFQDKGWKLLCKNYRSKAGEIDLIFRDPQETIVFMEVKWRSSFNYGMPYEAVNIRKQKRLIKTAIRYIQANQLFKKNLRFDIASLSPKGIEHIPNAFIAWGYTI